MVSIFQLGQEKPTSADRLENAYQECEVIARNASSSFFRSFRHLPVHGEPMAQSSFLVDCLPSNNL